MCLRNLFGGNECMWLLFFIILVLLAENDRGSDLGLSNNGCGCGC